MAIVDLNWRRRARRYARRSANGQQSRQAHARQAELSVAIPTNSDTREVQVAFFAVRVAAPVFVDDIVLEESAISAGDPADRLDEETCKAEQEVPPGEWRSLSAELLKSLYHWR